MAEKNATAPLPEQRSTLAFHARRYWQKSAKGQHPVKRKTSRLLNDIDIFFFGSRSSRSCDFNGTSFFVITFQLPYYYCTQKCNNKWIATQDIEWKRDEIQNTTLGLEVWDKINLRTYVFVLEVRYTKSNQERTDLRETKIDQKDRILN